MQKTEREYREDIVEIGRIVWEKGWVASNDGNITVRLDEDRILCTPTGMCKGMMHADDLIVCDMNGNKIAGAKESTSELAMHLAIYNLRPDIGSVVHAHPPVATGYATAGRSLDLALLPEVVIDLGCVPLAGYGLPGTADLTARMLPLIPKFDAMLMANHGAVCYGEDLHQAFFRMETTEHLARISLVAELLGGPKILPRIEVDKLIESRARYGVKARAADPRYPVAAEDAGEERFVVTRSELLALVDAALRARGSGDKRD
jgi:L-fuculose-phosphate aldolase